MSLRRLHIEDFGLIERADVALAQGLTAFTGETGSGKTMLLGALALALGERSDPALVRAAAKRARVTLTIEPDAALRAWFELEGFALDEGEDAVLERELNAAGKSTARINGRAASAAQLRAVAERTCEIVGQHEHQRLLGADFALESVDRFGGAKLSAERATVAGLFDLHRAAVEQRDELRAGADRAVDERNFAQFALAEIAAAAPHEGEDATLRERREFLSNVGRISAALEAAHAALTAEEVDPLASAATSLGSIARYNARLEALAETARALQSEASELAAAVAAEIEGAAFDPAEMDEVSARLDQLERLKKKYGGSLSAVLAARERYLAIVAGYESRDERLAELARRASELETQLAAAAAVLAQSRELAARAIETRVAAELHELAMPNARLRVALERRAEIARGGWERAEFVFAANAGEAARPLARAASGGELSRVLLALVVALAGTRAPRVLVFDEVDAGIGGATAKAVGERLRRLAQSGQVLCVTHLAQIASWADLHYALRKREAGASSTIEVSALRSERELRAEIARMLSGESQGVSIDHAGSLLREAAKQKRRLPAG